MFLNKITATHKSLMLTLKNVIYPVLKTTWYRKYSGKRTLFALSMSPSWVECTYPREPAHYIRYFLCDCLTTVIF